MTKFTDPYDYGDEEGQTSDLFTGPSSELESLFRKRQAEAAQQRMESSVLLAVLKTVGRAAWKSAIVNRHRVRTGEPGRLSVFAFEESCAPPFPDRLSVRRLPRASQSSLLVSLLSPKKFLSGSMGELWADSFSDSAEDDDADGRVKSLIVGPVQGLYKRYLVLSKQLPRSQKGGVHKLSSFLCLTLPPARRGGKHVDVYAYPFADYLSSLPFRYFPDDEPDRI